MSNFKHIIWDWNGTLLDDVKLLRDIVNSFLLQYDMNPLSEQEHQDLFGFPIKEYYIRMGFDFSRISYRQICVDFTREYYRRVEECHLREGALDLMQALDQKGLTQSILSVSEQIPLERTVKQFRIQHYFTDIVGREDHSGGSKLEMGRRFISRRGINPGKVFLVGDTVHDHEVAQDLGVSCLLVESGYQSRERLSRCGCPVMNSLREVLTHI
jgi:phosphoglycolate phosphatase